jgi:hypothetical protein
MSKSLGSLEALKELNQTAMLKQPVGNSLIIPPTQISSFLQRAQTLYNSGKVIDP